MPRIFKNPDEIDFKLSELPQMPVPTNVLMVKPTFFDVEYVINPHMEGQIGKVDSIQAINEWEHLLAGFKELGLKTHILNGIKGLPDMVFCANQTLPYVDKDENRKVVMSIMHAPQRKGEVAVIEDWFKQAGFDILHLDPAHTKKFEGMGDALWHFKRKLLWGAYGFRSNSSAYEQIAQMLDTPVITLELVDEVFYHLDTCMCILNEKSALIYPDAFTETGLEMIHMLFDQVILSTKYEAQKFFAANATCPDGKNVMIQQGSTDVNKKLRDAGFNVHEYSTYEFMKSGGSVFCMKQLFW